MPSSTLSYPVCKSYVKIAYTAGSMQSGCQIRIRNKEMRKGENDANKMDSV